MTQIMPSITVTLFTIAALIVSPWCAPGRCCAESRRSLVHRCVSVELVDDADGPAIEVAFNSQQSEPDQSEQPEANTDECIHRVDAPLTSLTVEIDSTVDFSERPLNCASYVSDNAPTFFVSGGSGASCLCGDWPGAQFCHRPLYFEEPCLERFGCARRCQPAVSACHFFGGALLMPAQLVLEPPTTCVQTPLYCY